VTALASSVVIVNTTPGEDGDDEIDSDTGSDANSAVAKISQNVPRGITHLLASSNSLSTSS
jgi:hypothetical protein